MLSGTLEIGTKEPVLQTLLSILFYFSLYVCEYVQRTGDDLGNQFSPPTADSAYQTRVTSSATSTYILFC